MEKLAQLARDLWADVMQDPSAREAAACIERDAMTLLVALQKSMTTTRMLQLVAAVGAAAREHKHAAA